MNINKIYLQNFTVFDKLELEFTEGINIFIGKNGTGKTHLLKSMYGFCENISDGYDILEDSYPYFNVDPMSLVRDKNDKKNNTNIDIYFTEGNSRPFRIGRDKYTELLEEDGSITRCRIAFMIKDIFIPAKEMLSHSKGFLAMYNKYNMPFDKTYVDILTNAELPETRKVSELTSSLLKIISKVIEGKVIYEDDTFYVIKDNGMKIEFSIEAEGLRKFGLLWKLLRNGLIEKDTILFWDEPEANINPELMPILVEIILELQKNGVQVFIATHSYNFAKYFEVKRKDVNQVMYHSLYKTEDGVKSESSKYFGNIKNNPIIEADSKLLDEVIEGNF